MTQPEINPFELEIAEMLAQRERTMQDFTPDHRGMAIYAIVRKDLEMDAGKIGSQAGHAYGEAVEHAQPDLLAAYKGTGHGTKLVMAAKNMGTITRIYREARAAGLPCYLVIDRNTVDLPHFTGKPIVTALALGPVFKDEVTFITKLLTLVK
jgi:peptidyl-tRNA hydrolase